MSEYLSKMEALGVDIQTTLERFMGNEDFYKKILQKFPQDESFKNAKIAMEEGRHEDAQLHIHTLKGVASNLGLTDIFRVTEAMMKDFRSGCAEGAYEKFGELEAHYGACVRTINEL